MTIGFNDFNLHQQLMQAIDELGYKEPTPIQAAIIPVLMEGHDVIGMAQTGTGKTAAYALPILQNLSTEVKNVQCLILAPTRELALQVTDAINDFGRFQAVKILAVYGGQPYPYQINSLRRGVDIVVGTPGRVLDLIQKGVLNLSTVKTLVLDEADEMLSMGFIDDIESILAQTPSVRQTALFSATVPATVRKLAEKYMREPLSISIQPEQVTVASIEQRYYLVNENDKLAALTRLFEIETVRSALIFVRTRSSSGDLANELTVRGFPAEVLNGDLTQDTRERVLNRFRQNQVKVLVATDVAARGLDIEDISHVFNFDLPDDDEIYVHRIGRTGRAGKTGISITLVTPSEQWRLRRIERFTRQKITRCNLPSTEDIQHHREDLLLNQVNIWLTRGRFHRERELIAQLIEQGHDPIEIAAAALKIARADEKQRPIAPISEVIEIVHPTRTPFRDPQPAASRQRRPGYSDRTRPPTTRISHEAGMVRLCLGRGRDHGVRPSDVVGTIAFHADIPGSVIGKILIQDEFTLVDVPENVVGRVLAKTNNIRMQNQPVSLEIA